MSSVITNYNNGNNSWRQTYAKTANWQSTSISSSKQYMAVCIDSYNTTTSKTGIYTYKRTMDIGYMFELSYN